jgi:F-type H+-transporting ATPase subunit b
MRIRKLIVAAVLGLATVVAIAGPVAAQEGPKDEFTKECIEKLEAGGKIDDCQESPSPIKPANNELIWGVISFTVLFVLLYKLAWPGLKQGLEQRTERIRNDIDRADAAKNEAEGILTEYQRQLADAKNEAGRIIEEARQTADAMRRDLQVRAEADIAEMRARAAADVDSAKTQAIADLRTEVAQLAIGAAEVVVQRNLDQATQVQLIENYINQLETQS